MFPIFFKPVVSQQNHILLKELHFFCTPNLSCAAEIISMHESSSNKQSDNYNAKPSTGQAENLNGKQRTIVLF